MKRILFAAAPVVALLLLTAGAQRASADTWYCGATQCSSSVPASGNYWIVNDTMTLGAGSSFDFKISFASVAGDPSAYLQDFSGQFFFGGTQLTNLSLTQANGWTDLEASKAGNNGTCNGNAPGSFCASSTGSSMILLTTSPTLFEVTGNYDGTFLASDGTYHLQFAAQNSNTTGNTGGNAFAISQDFNPTTGHVPDGGITVMFLGGALVGLEALRRRIRV